MSIYLLLILLYTTSVKADDIVIEDAGIGYVHDDDIAMIFYITVQNRCKYDFEISTAMLQCCETTKPDQADCVSMFLIGGNMGMLYSKEVKNITLIYPNLYLVNRQGICTVSVHYQNENVDRQINRDIEFSTFPPGEDQNQLCATMDLDPGKNCTPVDCVIKYSGGKSFFDHSCKECKCVPSCISGRDKPVPDTGYSIQTNNCTQLTGSIGKDDLEILDNNQAELTECGAENEITSSFDTNIVCHHGNLDSLGKCMCQMDWTTTIDDEMYQPMLMLYHMCNVEIGAWSCVNKGKIRTTALLIGIFAITIASKIIILMCVLNWCYKHYRSKKGSERICADKIDPLDASVLICEEKLKAEKCICDTPAKRVNKRRMTLKPETVNVSYYPCAPSTISSVRALTPRFELSAESIVLSNTTSSSAAGCAIQSDTEGMTEESEEVEEEVEEVEEEEEESYEIEFSGEGEEEGVAILDEARDEELTGEGGEYQMAIMGEGPSEQTEYSISAEDSRRGTSSSKTKSGSGQYFSDKAKE